MDCASAQEVAFPPDCNVTWLSGSSGVLQDTVLLVGAAVGAAVTVQSQPNAISGVQPGYFVAHVTGQPLRKSLPNVISVQYAAAWLHV